MAAPPGWRGGYRVRVELEGSGNFVGSGKAGSAARTRLRQPRKLQREVEGEVGERCGDVRLVSLSDLKDSWRLIVLTSVC